MKKKLILLLTIVLFIGNNSCKKSAEQNTNTDLTAPKTNVKTFEIVNLVSHKSLNNKYNGTFGTKTIDIIKTSDTTLSFFVPDVAAGESTLSFDLGSVKFSVTKTPEISATQFLTTFTQDFDAKINSLNPITPSEVAEVNSAKQYKQEVLALFNSLGTVEKRETILFYEANKDVITAFSNNTFTQLDSTTVMARQSDCHQETNYKGFYGCTANNLATSSIDAAIPAAGIYAFFVLANASTAIAPATFGLSFIGTALSIGCAGYLLAVKFLPAAKLFIFSTIPFLKAPFIFVPAFLSSTVEVFQEQVFTDLNLKPKFRSVSSNDGNLNTGTNRFITAMKNLGKYWNKLPSVFGSFPSYVNTEKATTLATNEVSVSDISNSNVQYLGNVGQSLKFKTTTGTEQTFSYKITLNKQGFTEEKVLNGKVLATNPCSNGSMTAPIISGVQIECKANGKISISVPFTANGSGALIGGGSGWCDALNTCYPTRLYFLNPGATDYSIAWNSYDVTLKSGNSNSGVVEITLNDGACQSGQTVAQALQATYPNYQWKVEMMNQCNQRSNQVSF